MNDKKPLILQVAVPIPLRQSFDYLPPIGCDPESLKPGMRLIVPFGPRKLVAVILSVMKESSAKFRLKSAISVLDEEPALTADVMQLCLWAADYYHHSIGEIIDSALPVLLRKGKSAEIVQEIYWRLTLDGENIDPATLNRAPQQIALLKLLRQHPEGLTQKQITKQKIPSAIIKALHKKGWIAILSMQALNASGQVCTNAHVLNVAQEEAVNAIKAATGFSVFLLDGVTGSGKTEVYLQAMTHILDQQKQVLVLVPEIGLTPQTIQQFRQRFSVPVVALHSGLSDKERLNAWLTAKSGAANIIIGTRSAIFTPFANLGLIVVDEEHDLSFKQQEGFRYHARDLAIMRAHFKQIPIIIGSATPSLEALHNAKQGRYRHLILPKRAGDAIPPIFQILDIRNMYLEEGLSASLLTTIHEHLDQNDQVMLFLNRRGFAPVYLCHGCGGVAKCRRCDARLTYHNDPKRLHCHHCDTQRPVFKKCDICQGNDLQVVGQGTERIEQAIQKHFPNHSIARIDRDSTKQKGKMEDMLEGIHAGQHHILIGTQMLAKGHHFPNVTLVGIIDADNGFFSADFRALERMGQLLLQVSGRAGRESKPGKVIIQTHYPEHPLLHQLINETYQSFAGTLLKEREAAHLPPFGYMALFRAEAHQESSATHFLQQVKNLARGLNQQIPIYGPVPAPMSRRAGRYRVQLLFQSRHRAELQQHLKQLLQAIDKLPGKQQVRWSLDVDPLEMF